MKPLISIITVCKNSEEFIQSCIKSVVEQDFTNFEYIVIDGGSTDQTVNIIKQYDEYIKYWHSKEDSGLAEAFNNGFKNSNGSWILYLNSDDIFSNINSLSKMAPFLMENQDSDVVMGQVDVVTREAIPKFIRGPYGSKFKWQKFVIQDTIPHQSAFINRNFFFKIGLFNEKLRIAVDYEHFLRCGKKIKVTNVPLKISLMRDGGLSQDNLMATIRDWHKARVLSGNINILLSLLIMQYQLMKLKISEILRK